MPQAVRAGRGPAAELIDAKAAEHDWRIVVCEITPDHVHLFVKTRPTDSPSFVANQFKGATSRALRQEFPHLRRRQPTLWSRSYFVASAGAVSAATVQRYIDTQYSGRGAWSVPGETGIQAPRVSVPTGQIEYGCWSVLNKANSTDCIYGPAASAAVRDSPAYGARNASMVAAGTGEALRGSGRHRGRAFEPDRDSRRLRLPHG